MALQQRCDLVRSIGKAFEILRAFAPDNTPVGVTELSQRLGLHKSTVHRFLRSLEANEMVRQDTLTGKYALDFSVLEFAGFITFRLDLVDAALPLLVELNRATNETANLGVVSGNQIVNIKQVISRRRVRADGWIGRKVPLTATASGRAVLASYADKRLMEFLNGLGNSVQAQHLLQEVQHIRRRGYATSLEEFEPGLSAVAAPVRDFQRRVVGTVGVMGPNYRFVGARVEEYGRHVLRVAIEITKRMAYLAESSGAPDAERALSGSPAFPERGNALEMRFAK